MQQLLTELVGNNFRSSAERDALTRLEVGDKLFVQRDSTNQYDARAVRVMWDELQAPDDEGNEQEPIRHFLGFVPAKDNLLLSQYLDAGGENVEVTIVSRLNYKKPGLEITYDEESVDLPDDAEPVGESEGEDVGGEDVGGEN